MHDNSQKHPHPVEKEAPPTQPYLDPRQWRILVLYTDEVVIDFEG